jgi:NAD(P)-dependent dehydrogenase (short-subunit alcohol dehydrogenase family)
MTTESMEVAVADRFRVDGKVALVTGASSGLGVAFATALAEAGADLCLAARRRDRLEQTKALVEGYGRRAVVIETDVSVRESCADAARQAVAAYGQVDILVNNAGVATAVPTSKETEKEFQHVLSVNLNGCYWMAQACGAVMEPGSSVINVSSVLGLKTAGLPQAAYAASKSGLIGLTRDLAQQWSGRKGIRVNALAPGFFASEMTEQYLDGYLDSMLARIPMGRHGDPSELAAALVFLASPAASFITGQTLAVDGGFTIA